MNIVFISPNYPAGHWRYIVALRDCGHRVLCIGDAGDETFPYELRGSLTDYIRVGDLHDYEEVYRACCRYVGSYGRIDRIESLNPYWSDLTAALSLELCLTPQNPMHCRRIAGEVCAALPELPETLASDSAAEVKRFAGQNGYPLLATPVENKRLGEHTLDDDKQVRALLSGDWAGEYFFRAVPKGDRVSVDGLAVDGVVVAAAAHLCEGGVICSLPADPSLAGRCESLLEGAGVDGFFHIDAVRAAEGVRNRYRKGGLVFLTLTEAPPHEYILDCMCAEFGSDLRALWAQGGQPEPLEQVSLAACVSRSFERSYKNPHESVLRKLNVKLVRHDRPRESDREGFGDYLYVFKGDTAAELRRIAKFITEDFS